MIYLEFHSILYVSEPITCVTKYPKKHINDLLNAPTGCIQGKQQNMKTWENSNYFELIVAYLLKFKIKSSLAFYILKFSIQFQFHTEIIVH